jgi:hypothetical protein
VLNITCTLQALCDKACSVASLIITRSLMQTHMNDLHAQHMVMLMLIHDLATPHVVLLREDEEPSKKG